MAYEIWENTSANLAGIYPAKMQALAAVAAYTEANGPAVAASFSLVHNRRGRYKTVASGAALVKMAVAPSPAAFTTTYATND